MKIPIIINNTKTVIESQPDKSLLSVLRSMKLFDTKTGCAQGICGNCTILLNGKPVPSCKIPVAIVNDQTVTTLEYFKQTEIYSNIIKGFSKAGIKMCGYCNAGKIFAAYSIITSGKKPVKQFIYEHIKNLSLCCTDTKTLAEGIIYACDLNLKNNGKNNE